MSLGDAAPSYATLYRAFRRKLAKVALAELRHGVDGRRAFEVYVHRSAMERNDLWELDWKEPHHALRGPDDRVLLDKNGDPLRPQVFTIVDAGTNPIVHSRPALRRSADIVLVGLLEAICGLGRGGFGGIPRGIRGDIDNTFQSDDVTRLIAAITPDGLSTDPYEPTHKPDVESLNSLIERRYSVAQPCYTRGPAGRDGNLYSPYAHALTVPEFHRRWYAFEDWVNFDYRSRALGGRTRAEAWAESPGRVEFAGLGEFREFLPSRTLKVLGDGVHIDDTAYVSDRIANLGGEKVHVYFLKSARQRVFVEHRGEWLGEAYRHDELSDGQRITIDATKSRRRAVAQARRARKLKRDQERAREMQPTTENDLAAPDLLAELATAERPARRERPASPGVRALLGTTDVGKVVAPRGRREHG